MNSAGVHRGSYLVLLPGSQDSPHKTSTPGPCAANVVEHLLSTLPGCGDPAQDVLPGVIALLLAPCDAAAGIRWLTVPGNARQGPSAPQLLLALSSESTTASYDCVFLRSITEA